MERAYIHELNNAYEEFFSKPYDHTPVLKIDTNDLDIVRNTEHLHLIQNRIRQTLNLTRFSRVCLWLIGSLCESPVITHPYCEETAQSAL